MLKSLRITGFKSLRSTGSIELSPLTLLIGPNAAGKSNFLDAVLLLSRLSTARTVPDALEDLRGQALELFSFPESGGLPELLALDEARCRLSADLASDRRDLRYEVELSISPRSGEVWVVDELLTELDRHLRPIHNPLISREGDRLHIRRRGSGKHPFVEALPLNHTSLSNQRYSGRGYEAIERARLLLASIRTYYLDPRSAMREARPPQKVDDIGTRGEHLGPFLYRLQATAPKAYAAVERTLRSIIPSIDGLSVSLDEQRGIVQVEVTQDGVPFSTRVLSEGTLRVLALACVVVNPWGGPVVAFEEPENGVHPRRIELIATLLESLVSPPGRSSTRQPRQLILTTHSPLVCRSLYRLLKERQDAFSFYRAVRDGAESRFEALVPSELFHDQELREALRDDDEDHVVESLLVRGLLDG